MAAVVGVAGIEGDGVAGEIVAGVASGVLTGVAAAGGVPSTGGMASTIAGIENGTVAVAVELPPDSSANTVPVSCASVGLVVASTVIVRHGGGPAVYAVFETGSHAPLPPLAVGSHHWAAAAPGMPQSWIVSEVKLFGVDACTSK